MDLSELRRTLQAGGKDLLDKLELVASRGLGVLKIPQPMLMWQWAEKHFYLSAESSYVEAKWLSYPFQRPIMVAIGHDDVEIIDWRKSARQGYTKLLLIAIGYFIHHKRRKIALYQPTDDDRDDFVEAEIDPMIRDVSCMRAIFPSFKSRSSGNTRRFKRFLTGLLHLRGGTAAKNFRRLTVDVVMYDELDAFPRDVEKEGAATKLGDKRLEGATWPKSIRGTTPKQKHSSNIEDCEQGAALHFKWNVPCPLCDVESPLLFGQLWPGGNGDAGGFKWAKGDAESVRHVCPHCREGMTQSQYLEVWHRGRMVAVEDGTWIDPAGRFVSNAGETVRPPRHIAFHTWTAISPQAAWAKLVDESIEAEDLAARGDFSAQKTFVNTTLGETWEEKGEGGDEDVLLARAKGSGYKLGAVPIGCLMLFALVDVQDNRFVITVWGFGRGEQMWVIDDRELEANPADERDWLKLDAFLQTRYRQLWHGGTLSIEAVGIDTGGHFTHQVYNFVRLREHRRVTALKGSSKYGGPIKGRASRQDVNFRGQVLKNGVKLWEVGTDTAKDLVFGRLQVVQPGAGHMNFPEDLPRWWFEELTAEVRVLQKTATGEVYRWVKRRARNERLDNCVYAIFMSHLMDLHRYSDAMWDRLEAAVQPPPDLFAAQPAAGDAADLQPADDGVHTRAQEEMVPRATRTSTSFERAW
jgi:phage terminase large subunit GpA-like protein